MNNIIICFTISDDNFYDKTVVEMQKYLFDCFSIEDPQSSLLAFETESFTEYTKFERKIKVVKFFNKIYAKIQNPNLKIEEISPYISFGIKYKGNENIPNCGLTPNITKEYIYDYKIYQEYENRINCINKDFKFTSADQSFFLSFYSNFKLSKIDFEFCKKFYIKNIAKITGREHIGFLVLKVGIDYLETYKNIFNDLCNRTKEINNLSTFKFQFLQCFVTSESKALSSPDKSSPILSSFSFLRKIYTKLIQFSYYLKKKLIMPKKLEKKFNVSIRIFVFKFFY
ncbi:hypothetical protein GVAV_000340 [Gurleya vavrai]